MTQVLDKNGLEYLWGKITSKFTSQEDFIQLQNLLKLDLINWYGIKWTDSNTTPVRIGNAAYHQSLPILSKMRRCVLEDDGTVVGYISDSDPDKYENGDTVNYNGSDGQIMVEIPEYYYDAFSLQVNDTVTHALILYPYSTKYGKRSNKFYVGAFEACSDDADSSASTKKLYSICTTNFTVNDNSVSADSLTYDENATKYRGGSSRTTSTSDSTLSSNLGRPITSLTRNLFRQRALNRGTGWSLLYWGAYMAIIRLYVVEYCNFNSQSLYNATLDTNGYKQGGLGAGVSNVNSTYWNAFNSYNPLSFCGITKQLINNTGLIKFIYAPNTFGSGSNISSSSVTLTVPSYRGIENPWGHIWKFTDGINIYIDTNENKTYVYTCDDITKFADGSGDNIATNGYLLRTDFAYTANEGFIKTWLWDSYGDFIPTSLGGSSASYLYDYCFISGLGWRVLLSGGGANIGSVCGWFCFHANYGSGNAWASYGGRLYYTPIN